jgi:hypothetical protein
MASLRATAQCIGLSGQISIRTDFYGYRTKVPLSLSLLAQVRLLQGKHIHLNLIQTASFDDSQQEEIDYGLQVMRNIYATVNMGVGRIQRFFIPPGHEVIDGDSEAKDLWNEFSVSNAGIDVFLVLSIVGDSNGKSRTPGSCDKDSKNDSGCVIEVKNTADGTGVKLGQTIGHEVGHYLGLDQDFKGNHSPDPNNLMFHIVSNGGQLTGGQGGVMKLHCSMRAGCQA